MSVIDKSGWTIYEPSRCECTSSRIATINTAGGTKVVFIVELFSLDRGIDLIKYFNVVRTPKGSYSVKHNSDFAKLYRTTIGKNPISRYTRADQLLRHLEGKEFIAEYIDASTNQIEHYFKATKLEPVDPIITNEWFETGVLKAKKRGRRYNKENGHKIKKNKQQIGNELAKVKQKVGNDLATGKAESPHLNLELTDISIPLTSLKHDIEPLPHTGPMVDRREEHRTVIDGANSEKVYHYHQHPNETQQDYHERVIDESFSCNGYVT